MSEALSADAIDTFRALDRLFIGTVEGEQASVVTMSGPEVNDTSASAVDGQVEEAAALATQVPVYLAQATSRHAACDEFVAEGAAANAAVVASDAAGVDCAAGVDRQVHSSSASVVALPDGNVAPPRVRKRPRPGERRMQILQMLAEMLESPQSDRVTTAALAARLQVSEAALYRHFASKAQMFEGLIGFIEQTLFSLINQITSGEQDGFEQLRAIFTLLLTFAERNPGMTRVLVGDALVTEADRLQERINQLTDRLELSIKQCYRTLVAEGRLPPGTDPAARANLMMSCVQGRWLRFAKGGFKRTPTDWLELQAALLISQE